MLQNQDTGKNKWRLKMPQKRDELAEKVKKNLEKIKHRIIVLSGKGGVGKSSVSVNVATALWMKGKKVGILDIDIHGPSIGKMTGISPTQKLPLNDKGEPVPVEIRNNFYVLTIALLLDSPDTPVIWRGPLKMGAIKQFLGDIVWPELDYLIIDCPPGTGDEPLSAVQLIGKVDGSIIVSTPQEVSFLDARKTINFSKMVGVPVIGIIENMSGFKCPRCGEITYIFKSGGAQKAARELNVDILAQIPFELEMVECGDSGILYVEKYPENEGAKKYLMIAEALIKKFEQTESDEKKESSEKKEGFMRIAIPLAEGKLSPHFGHCEEFGLYDIKGKEIVAKKIVTPPPHEPGVIPRFMKEQGVDLIIAGGMGQRAIQFFNDYGIKVLVGAPVKTPEELINDYLNGTLELGENVCSH